MVKALRQHRSHDGNGQNSYNGSDFCARAAISGPLTGRHFSHLKRKSIDTSQVSAPKPSQDADSGWKATVRLVVAVIILLPLLAACGFGGDDNEQTGQIQWVEGNPPADSAQAPTVDPSAPTEVAVAAPTDAAPPPTEPPAPTVPPTEAAPPVTGTILTDAEIAQYQPNELGQVPVIMYHNVLQEYGENQQGDVLFRTESELRADLDWLYANNFYVVPFHDYLTNAIKAPAGKHPVVITFDDSRPNQFRFLVNEDGSTVIDPDSAVGILEDFFAAHPDFGRTAFFSILPIWCFDFEEPDQTEFCNQKLQWLVANGYEVGNHTWDHQDLGDVSNELFQSEIVDTTRFLDERAPDGKASRILILPYGVFPSGAERDAQWDMIRNGFVYEGEPYELMSVVAAGANPAYSPASLDFDIMSIARIGGKDDPLPGEADLFLNFWFGQFESNPSLLYTSDGNPDTITIPEGYLNQLDEDKVASEGKQVIVY